MRRLAAVVIGCVLLAAPAAAADLTLYGAGSLRGAMLRIAEAFRQSGGAEVTASFGPSGTMRERIEAGDKVDIVCRAGQEGAAVGWLIEHDRADMVLGHRTSGKTA